MSVALIDFNGVVYFVDDHGVVSDVVDLAATAASLQVTTELGRQVRPDLDASAVLFLSAFLHVERLLNLTHSCVVHRGIEDVDILHNVVFSDVLSQRTD